MTAVGWIQILVFLVIVLAGVKPIGFYMFRVYEGDRQPLPRVFGPIERLLYRLCGIDVKKEQSWKQYALAMLVFSAVTMLVTYAILRLQYYLPLNPQRLPAPSPHLSFNTAASFTTNTNWQSYGGETTMSYLSQIAGLAWHQFISAGAGLGVALAMARGLTRRVGPEGEKTLGNFWVDLIRSIVYILLPLSVLVTIALVAGGVIQNLSGYLTVDTVEGGKQTLAMGPAAAMVAIKQLGSNGGGFFNVNSSHPFENATAFTNLVECWAILAIPAAMTYTYGKMARDTKQGWAIRRHAGAVRRRHRDLLLGRSAPERRPGSDLGGHLGRQPRGQGDALRRRQLGRLGDLHDRCVQRLGQLDSSPRRHRRACERSSMRMWKGACSASWASLG